MSDKKSNFTAGSAKVAKSEKEKKSPRDVLLDIQSRLKQMLKDIEGALKSEGWHDGMAYEYVQQQIEETRWNH